MLPVVSEVEVEVEVTSLRVEPMRLAVLLRLEVSVGLEVVPPRVSWGRC